MCGVSGRMFPGPRGPSLTLGPLIDQAKCQVAKFLLLIAVFIVAYLVVKSGARRREREVEQRPARPVGEDMVRCKVCGVHLPRSEGLTSRGEYFCSEEHRRIAKK